MKVEICSYYIELHLISIIIEHEAKFKAENRSGVYINATEIEEGGGTIAEWRVHRFKGDEYPFKTSSK